MHTILPKHIAIIMDGNGRWAEARNLPRLAGHEEGVQAIERTIKAAIKHHVPLITLFAFGIENWRRPASEVNFLMELFAQNLKTQIPQFIENNIRLRVIGDRARIQPEFVEQITQAEVITRNNTQLTLVIAFNYSGRWDIVQASQKLCTQALAGKLDPANISEQDFQQALCLADLPEPDLFIRSSGEQRLSNFLLWQQAYTELYFTETLWPDFNEEAFAKALQAFASRQRRYGRTGQQVKEQV